MPWEDPLCQPPALRGPPVQEEAWKPKRLPPPLPPRLGWFLHTQAGTLAQTGIPTWFHGAITRQDTEDLLESQPPGAFLVRVSHSHVGYTLSYRARSGCRHFMVKLLDTGSFQIPGEPRTHASLDALVAFHQRQPLRPHQELLTQPCGQKDPEHADYEALFLYHNAAAEETQSPPQSQPCPWVPTSQAAPRTDPDQEPRARRRSAGDAAPRALLQEARLRLWRSLKTLPEVGRKVQCQLKAQRAAATPDMQDALGGTVLQGESPPTAPEAWLPEEYHPPPPFAPGYC